MANQVRVTENLQLTAEFYDSDDRTFNLPNPKATVTAAQIKAVGTYFKTNNVIIGDKAGSSFERFKKANRVKNTSYIFDLS